MSVILSKHPSRAVELLEYLSLIRYAAKYHRGLGWCTYDVKFPQKAAANKSALWSVIDSQLWLKTFTVASSPLKEDIFFSNRDPHPRQVHLEGTSIVLATTSTRVGSVLGLPAPMHKCNKPGCGGDQPGHRCPTPSESNKQPLPRAGKSNSEQHGSHHRSK